MRTRDAKKTAKAAQGQAGEGREKSTLSAQAAGMKKKSRPKAAGPSRSRENARLSAAKAIDLLFEHLGGADQGRLVQLWRHWEMVMGPDLSCLGRPLGHKANTLIVGAQDAMAMQELSMQATEILERANAFMDQDFFHKVRVTLMQERPDLARPREEPEYRAAPLPPGPSLGAHLGRMDPDSPVTRCYQAFAGRGK